MEVNKKNFFFGRWNRDVGCPKRVTVMNSEKTNC